MTLIKYVKENIEHKSQIWCWTSGGGAMNLGLLVPKEGINALLFKLIELALSLLKNG